MTDMIAEFYELAQIDAASGNERAVADVLTEKLLALGFSVREDDAGPTFGGNAGNLIAVLEGTAPGSVMLCSHMDRVANGLGIRPIEKDGFLCTDGSTILAADDLAGVCAILNGVRRTLESGTPHPRIEVVFTVGEESNMWGGRHLDLGMLQSRLCYVLDSPGPIGRVVNNAPGRAALKVEVTGRPAHAGNEPEKGINAAHILCHILDTLKDGRLDFETVSNFPVISTNCTVCNVVCDKASARGEARSRDEKKLAEYTAYFEAHCQKAAEGTGARVSTSVSSDFPSFFIPESAPVITLARRALAEMGIPIRVEAGGGGMDANFFNAAGLPSLGVATGYTENHTCDEKLALDSFLKSGELVQRLISLCIEPNG